MRNIKSFFEKYHPISKEDWKYFESKIISKRFKKNEILTKSGEVENYIYYIKSGMSMVMVEKNKKEYVLEFKMMGEPVSIYSSFLTRKPADMKLIALSNMEVDCMSYDLMQEFLERVDYANYIIRKITEEQFILKAEREKCLIKDPALERYLKLLHKRPELFRQVSLGRIAAYIGVAPQTLSRLRHNIIES
ncbi:Crp/Fnr family transcriptional regulator [Bacteroidetes bacterium endosymbiont of Geopemphigus sp.]|uniref:Crp/Fnr family transcriptional regulator n=1 Tax=Bacteroidetes bacterium endosymbiont of Geopemphigus sp. TaxID=2047937 RepID=UPI000CD1EB56|nr:cyclic nucleotide-binding domain-containing protein [Bacteroidetes bacterium endosymbiont of Geopemphigus sp.]